MLKKFIKRTIRQQTLLAYSQNIWRRHRPYIYKQLELLQPDKPVDGTFGFIAFNVGAGKPRMKIKTGRFLTKKLGLNKNFMADKIIQKIATLINTYLFPDIHTALVRGSAITDAYSDEIGGHSCMTRENSCYTRLYEQNPDRFQMLIMQHGGNAARAIVHKLDNGDYLMDRVYADNETLREKMRDYAIDHKWFYHKFESIIEFAHEQISDYDNMIVSNLFFVDGEIPFMDTLKKYSLNGDKMNIFHTKNSTQYFEGMLESSRGYLQSPHICEFCDRGIEEEENVWVVGELTICPDCYENYYFLCVNCKESYNIDDRVYIQDEGVDVCYDCAERYYTQCAKCYDWYKEVTAVKDGDEVCDDCLARCYKEDY